MDGFTENARESATGVVSLFRFARFAVGLWKVLVDVFSVANFDDQDDKLVVMDFVDNAVVA